MKVLVRPCRTRLHAACLLPFCAMFLAGCGTVAVKDALHQEARYLADNFTPAQLAPDVRKKIEPGSGNAARFKSLRLTYRTQTDEEGRLSELVGKVELFDLGNGYVQRRTEFARNDIPYRVNLALTYAGMYRLKTQTLFLNRSNAQPAVEIKTLARFDHGLANPQPGAIYHIEASSGTSMQIASFLPENAVCTAGNPMPAAQIFPRITGDAIPLDCTVRGANDAVVSRTGFNWLRDYGVAIEREGANAQSKARHTVTGFEVSR